MSVHAESVKPTSSSSEGSQHHQSRHKQLDREIRDMVTAITNRLTNIQKSTSNNQDQLVDESEEDKGVRIITLTGTNAGATLRGELDDKPTGGLDCDKPSVQLGESEALRTYVNSNFQAVNNSIMMGGSYNTNDPGVHVDISDFIESTEAKPELRRGWIGKKKNKEAFKSTDRKSDSSE